MNVGVCADFEAEESAFELISEVLESAIRT